MSFSKANFCPNSRTKINQNPINTLQKEMEEARWKEGKGKARERLGRLLRTHQKYASLIEESTWKREEEERERWLRRTRGVKERLLKFLGPGKTHQ